MSQIQQIAAEISNLFRSSASGSVNNINASVNAFIKDRMERAAQGIQQNSHDEQQQAKLATFKEMADACLSEHMVQATSAMFLDELAAMSENTDLDLSNQVRKEFLAYLLSKIQQRTSVYEEVNIKTRKALSNILIDEKKWEEAAEMLQGIRFEQSQRSQDANLKFDVYVTIMDLFLRAKNISQAAQSLNRAASLAHTIKDAELIVKYRYLQACILDHSQKYIEAANGYRNVAQSVTNDTQRQRDMLDKAVKCAVLASAGPQKIRVMATLQHLPEAAALPCFKLLEKMLLQRLIKPDEVDLFSKLLDEHQRQTLGNTNSTILEHAVREHNFENLSHMLGTSAEDAELICARMIAEGRMKGHIDQISSVITFEGAREIKDVSAAIFLKRQASAQKPPMHLRERVANRWDERIVNLCTAVEDAVDLLIERQPVYTKMLFRRPE
ncbi:hypothetical protein BX070DRAFT_225683 [Coemansia spiralis]|nr:hypothetical protein BX070DRAFT_225683 [Coemansia spiralis]